MAKRRRERDRPKSGPEDAEFNPNKRILLSYGDEEDDESEVPDVKQPAAGGRSVMEDAQLTNYQIEEYPNEDDEIDAEAGAVAEVQDGLEERRADEKASRGEIKKNKATNMFPALGLASFQFEEDGGSEEEELDSETQEAMAYLKAVRSERQNLPQVLGKTTDSGNGTKKWDPATEDAYIGYPNAEPTATEDLSDPQIAFTKVLIRKFHQHRSQLQQPASFDALKALDDSQPISFLRGNNKAHAEWHRILSSKPSQAAQVRSLQQDTVFDLLALIQKHFLAKGKNIHKVTSSWIWSLLARLEDVGNMNNDDVYPLRELGKRAVFVQYSITQPEVADQLEALGQAGIASSQDNDEIMDQEENLETGDKSSQAQQEQPGVESITNNTKATLDMILVIIGEVFRQRDLLEFRQLWPTTSSPQ